MTPSDRNDDHLSAVKTRLSAKYLGRDGIHGFGVRRSENAICIYVKNQNEMHPSLLEEIQSHIGPHRLLVIEDGQPRANRRD